MVVFTVVKEIIKAGIRYGSKYYAYESKAFNTLYRGFPQSKTIGRGVRHGLTGGSVIGSLIADDSPGNGNNGFQKTIQRKFSKTSKPYKTRSRRSVCYPAKYSGKHISDKYR